MGGREDKGVASAQERRPQPEAGVAANLHSLSRCHEIAEQLEQLARGEDNEFAKGVTAKLDAQALRWLLGSRAELLGALKDAVEALEQTLHWRGDCWECSEDELLGSYRAAIAKAEPASPIKSQEEEG